MKTGVFGGTFDPPHTGHLIVAQDAALALGLDRILFVPAAQPPHKLGQFVTPAEVRARMLRLAVEADSRFALDMRELEREGPSYTVDTLRSLSEQQPGTRWTLLMGVDQYDEFHSWRGPEEIRQLAELAVLTRSGGVGGAAPSAAAAGDGPAEGRPAVRLLPAGDTEVTVTRIDISSTLIRARVAAGLPVRYLVPPAVEQFIADEGLYRRNGVVVSG